VRRLLSVLVPQDRRTYLVSDNAQADGSPDQRRESLENCPARRSSCFVMCKRHRFAGHVTVMLGSRTKLFLSSQLPQGRHSAEALLLRGGYRLFTEDSRSAHLLYWPK
jgi:hypothetical protein